jgi:hypothetical protein
MFLFRSAVSPAATGDAQTLPYQYRLTFGPFLYIYRLFVVEVSISRA